VSDEYLVTIKGRWNQILDRLLEINRIAWLAYFDARITGLEEGQLLLSFADSEKFGGDHDFARVRNPLHAEQLSGAIFAETGIRVQPGESR